MTTRDEVLAMARDAGFAGYGEESGDYTIPVSAFESRLERFHALAVAKEREECAKVCDCYVVEDSPVNGDARLCAKTIRARSAK